jgi:hypothetical protein
MTRQQFLFFFFRGVVLKLMLVAGGNPIWMLLRKVSKRSSSIAGSPDTAIEARIFLSTTMLSNLWCPNNSETVMEWLQLPVKRNASFDYFIWRTDSQDTLWSLPNENKVVVNKIIL